MRKTLLGILFAGLAGAATAEAGVRNYFSPEVEGARVDACLAANECGKPAADAFCKSQGFETALLFQREAHEGTSKPGSQAKDKTGTVFRQIKCYSRISNS